MAGLRPACALALNPELFLPDPLGSPPLSPPHPLSRVWGFTTWRGAGVPPPPQKPGGASPPQMQSGSRPSDSRGSPLQEGNPKPFNRFGGVLFPHPPNSKFLTLGFRFLFPPTPPPQASMPLSPSSSSRGNL